MTQAQKPRLTILGLGPGDPGLLTREAWQVLESTAEIHLRTRQHPTVSGFPSELKVYSFDKYYQDGESFPDIYRRIVEQVIELSMRSQGVIYGVPGDPLIAEATSLSLIGRAQDEQITYRIVSGLSFLEPVFSALEMDPLPRTVLLDALEVIDYHHPPFPPDAPALIAQIYSSRVASHLKLTLMAVYPDDHPVKMIRQAGTPGEVVEELSLYQVDRSARIGNLTCLYLPPLGEGTSFEAFQEVIAHLRAPDGCPWDREQTHMSLRPHLLEETYEVIQAIDDDDPQGMQEELGDLLLQIVLHSQIALEDGEFSMVDILQDITKKIVSRHPHVFADLNLDDTGKVLANWERLKAAERQQKGALDQGVLDGIAAALPALSQAQTIQKRVSRVGFDWPQVQGVIEKIAEEVEELQQADTEEQRKDELGDLFFALVNLSRWYDIDAESALREANSRFRTRFAFLEKQARKSGRNLEDLSLEEMDAVWEQAKNSSRSQGHQ